MRVEELWLSEVPTKNLDLGFVGEKNHTKIVIMCANLFYKYPDAAATLAVKPPVGDTYPVVVTKDGTNVIWNVGQGDIAYEGSGQYQLTFTEDGEIIKEEYGQFFVKPSLTATGEAPDPVEDWLTAANEALAGLEAWEDVTVTGTTPSITGEANKRYVCGEVSTISITPPESGMIDVVFTSGSTATVLTATGVNFPEWFSGTLEANTRYEINILDGYGVITAWAST